MELQATAVPGGPGATGHRRIGGNGGDGAPGFTGNEFVVYFAAQTAYQSAVLAYNIAMAADRAYWQEIVNDGRKAQLLGQPL